MKKITDNTQLKIGDLIWFHNWGIGGFLFGVIMNDYDNHLYIWRAKSNFSLDDIDAIEPIKSIEDVKSYALYDFKDFLNDIKTHNIPCNFIP